MKKHSRILLSLAMALLMMPSNPAAAQQGQTAPATNTAPKEDLSKMILTPKPSPKPRINGAKVFGVRPGNPFFFTIPATGDRPMTFSADNLPAGLQLDAQTGRITGSLSQQGEYNVILHAKNSRGQAKSGFKIVCGPTIGLTPALGWNSWNVFGPAVTAALVQSNADAMVSSGLINHGWTYMNIDDYWEKNEGRASRDPTLGGVGRDEQGRIVPNPRFPDMKGLVDHIHGLGLKAGIYSGPGPTTCGGCIASWEHEDLDAQQYADWGFDYLKYDWCSYSSVAPVVQNTNTTANGTNAAPRRRGAQSFSQETLMKPYQVMRDSLNKVHRDIMYSLCQYGWGDVWKWGADPSIQGNSWRTTGDISDNWRSLSGNGFRLGGHEQYVGPGHFDDPDMLIVGILSVASGRNLHPTRLTADEQYTHISLWCLLTSPLLIGCDMTRLDDFTLNLLCNDEVLAVDQDPLARQASRVVQDTNTMTEVWAKDMADGSKAVGLFNRSDKPVKITAKWSDIKLTPVKSSFLGIPTGNKRPVVRDLWRQKNLGKFKDQFEATVPSHGVILVKIDPKK